MTEYYKPNTPSYNKMHKALRHEIFETDEDTSSYMREKNYVERLRDITGAGTALSLILTIGNFGVQQLYPEAISNIQGLWYTAYDISMLSTILFMAGFSTFTEISIRKDMTMRDTLKYHTKNQLYIHKHT